MRKLSTRTAKTASRSSIDGDASEHSNIYAAYFSPCRRLTRNSVKLGDIEEQASIFEDVLRQTADRQNVGAKGGQAGNPQLSYVHKGGRGYTHIRRRE